MNMPVYRPPVTRADCAKLPRPCPQTKCRHHLPFGCVLDAVEERGAHSLPEIAAAMGASTQLVHHWERLALAKLRRFDAATYGYLRRMGRSFEGQDE